MADPNNPNAQSTSDSWENNPWRSLMLNDNGTRKEAYLASDQGREEQGLENIYDEQIARIDSELNQGKITQEEALARQEAWLNRAVDSINEARSHYQAEQVARETTAQPQIVETAQITETEATNATEEKSISAAAGELLAQIIAEEEKAKATAAESAPATEEERTKAVEEERAKATEEILAREAEATGAEELATLYARLGDIDKDIKAKEAALANLPGEPTPEASKPQNIPDMVALNADFTHDRAELAKHYANEAINKEKVEGGLLKRYFVGTLFKKAFEKKYERELISGKRKVTEGDSELTLDELIASRKASAFDRLTREDDAFVHRAANEERVLADPEVTERLKSLIEEFALKDATSGSDREKLKREFEEEVGRRLASERDEGKLQENNYFDLVTKASDYVKEAKAMKDEVDARVALEEVMSGFKLYNADVRNNVRTKEHRDAIDKIVDAYENGKVSRFIPPEIIAGGLGIASLLAQSSAKALAGVGGGLALSSIASGLREHNRVTEDRAQMLRNQAQGLDYEGARSEDPKGKFARYEAKINGTTYDLQKATDLTASIKEAMAQEGEDRSEAILQALAAARTRIEISDVEDKDLIAYSSPDKVGDERLALDIAIVEAMQSLSEADRSRLTAAENELTAKMYEGIKAKDKEFTRVRRELAAKKAVKNLLIGAGTFFLSQEVIATLDPGKIGVLEKAGIIKTNNRENASETILAGLAGPRVRAEYTTQTIENVRGDEADRIRDLESQGYQKIETTPAKAITRTDSVSYAPADSPNAIKVAYDGWANNGTESFDGNELRAYLVDGKMVSGMMNNSTMGGQSFNYADLATQGKMKGFITIGGSKFELMSKVNEAGQLTWGENGVFTTTAGETIKAIGDNGEKLYKYFEIAMDNGVDANGVQHIIPFATDIGRNSFDGVMNGIASVPDLSPALYTFTKTLTNEVPRAITYSGAFVPDTARVGLGVASANAAPSQSPVTPVTETSPVGSIPGAVVREQLPENPATPAPEQAPEAAPATNVTAETTEAPEVQPITPVETQPEPAETQPEPAETTPESVEAPAAPTPEQAPATAPGATEAATEAERQALDTFRTRAESLSDLIGEQGVSFLTDPNSTAFDGLNNGATYSSWWDGLSDEARTAVEDYMRDLNNSTAMNSVNLGNGIRSWYNLADQIPAGA